MRGVVFTVCLALVVIWNAALIAAPNGELPGLSAATYLAGSLICHQQPERSFHRGGAQFPVCTRCHGLYLGALFGVLGWVLFAGAGRAPRQRAVQFLATDRVRRLLVLTAFPTVVTVALAWIGVWDATNLLRAVLAIPLGSAIAAIVVAVAAGDLR